MVEETTWLAIPHQAKNISFSFSWKFLDQKQTNQKTIDHGKYMLIHFFLFCPCHFIKTWKRDFASQAKAYLSYLYQQRKKSNSFTHDMIY